MENPEAFYVPSGVVSITSDTSQQRLMVFLARAVAQVTFSHPDCTVGSGFSPDLLISLRARIPAVPPVSIPPIGN